MKVRVKKQIRNCNPLVKLTFFKQNPKAKQADTNNKVVQLVPCKVEVKQDDAMQSDDLIYEMCDYRSKKICLKMLMNTKHMRQCEFKDIKLCKVKIKIIALA